ncbi:MAG: hypothetical protein RIS64_4475, partial [Bacteroidota bacterium]
MMKHFFKMIFAVVGLLGCAVLPNVVWAQNNKPLYESGRIYVRVKDASSLVLPTGSAPNTQFRQVNNVFSNLYNQQQFGI